LRQADFAFEVTNLMTGVRVSIHRLRTLLTPSPQGGVMSVSPQTDHTEALLWTLHESLNHREPEVARFVFWATVADCDEVRSTGSDELPTTS